MDPLAITTGVLSLLGTCFTIVSTTKDFYDGVAIVDFKVLSLLSDVESFTQTLQGLNDVLDEKNVRSSFQITGHIGTLWTKLSTSIKDGQTTLAQLQSTLDRVNKTVGVLDGPRKHLRLKGAMDEITMSQQQIKSYRDTIQLALQTFILWNQVSVKESTDMILPNLDELYDFIRRATSDINNRMDRLQHMIESTSKQQKLESYSNLRDCVRSAATVVTSASTIIGESHATSLSTYYGSEFGDIFPSEPSESMLRWISSNTVNETLPRPEMQATDLDVRKGIPDQSDHSDSDNDLEAAKIKALLKNGTQKLDAGDYDAAARLFRNCLTRSSSVETLTQQPWSKGQIMGLLVQTYNRQGKWIEAKKILIEKIGSGSHRTGGDSSDVLKDVLVLVDVSLKTESYAEAQLYARRAHKGYKRLGDSGVHGVYKALQCFVEISRAEGNLDEEEAYTAILSDFMEQQRPGSLQKPTSLQHNNERAAQSEETLQHGDGSWPQPESPVPPIVLESTQKIESELRTGISGGIAQVEVEDHKEDDTSHVAAFLFKTNISEQPTDILQVSTPEATHSNIEQEDQTEHKTNGDDEETKGDPSDTSPTDERPSQEHGSDDTTDQGSSRAIDEQSQCSEASTDLLEVDASVQNPSNKVTGEDDHVSKNFTTQTTVEKSTFVFTWPHPAKEVYVIGTFNNWEGGLMDKVGDGFEKEVTLPSTTDTVYYKYVVDGNWIIDHTAPQAKDSAGYRFNVLSARSIKSGFVVEEDLDRDRAPVLDDDVPEHIDLEPFTVSSNDPDIQDIMEKTSRESAASKSNRRKLVIVGDPVCGKTCLLYTWVCGATLPRHCYPRETVFGIYNVDVELDGRTIGLGLWDTPGNESSDRLRPVSYPDSHVVLICFSIGEPDSLENVEQKWISEVLHFNKGTPILLLGMKKDLRFDSGTVEELARTNRSTVTPEQGEAMRQKIGAYIYLECSAKTGEGVREVRECATRLAIPVPERKKGRPTFRNLFSRNRT